MPAFVSHVHLIQSLKRIPEERTMSVENLLSLGAYLGLLVLLTPLLGRYLAQSLSGQRVFLSPLVRPIELFVYRVCLIDESHEMHWRKYASSLLWFSIVGIASLWLMQVMQHELPLNPQNQGAVPWLLALNTAISFVTNTNWQAYSGENTLSYFTQAMGLGVHNFTSAAVGVAVLLALIRGLTRKNSATIGNFFVDVVRSFLYVLLPLSLLCAFFLVSQGVLQNFSPYVAARTIEGHEQILPMGPVASQVAIKQLGTNGGGFFGVNSAHPFENPTPLSNFIELLALLLIPSALIHMFGLLTNQKRHARTLFAVVSVVFMASLIISLWAETRPNPAVGTDVQLVGKEVRFGVSSSILWSTATTAASNGSVNAMHDSLSPCASGIAMTLMLLGEVIFGGVGSGLYGLIMFVFLTVFLAGLMVGRSPQYLGKKIEPFEMQMALLALIIPSAVVLLGASISVVVVDGLKGLLNHGPHGLSEILYAWASAANNNGSAMGGLNVNTDYYNIGLGLAMLVGRFFVIVPVVAIAGSLAQKKILPETAATLKTHTPLFATLLIFVMLIIGALTFFPVLVLGPIAEHFLMMAQRTF